MIVLREWTRSLRAVLLIALLAGGIPHNASAEDNGLERTPVLGWSSWSFLRKHPTAAQVKAQALALHDSGLQKIGYQYVNLDDFWYQCPGPQGPNVDSYGRWMTDPSRFPAQGDTDGIKVVADYIHSLGMKFGIYVTPGISKQAVSRNTPIKGTSYTAAQIADPSVEENNYNCKGMVRIDYNKPGAQEYTNSWVNMLAAWGVDYIKIDGMKDSNAADVKAWSNAIRQSGRPMVLDVTQGNLTIAIAPTLMKYANQWEFAPDVECYRCEKGGSSYPLTSWANVAKRFNYVAEWQPYAGPGAFNDYDSIEVGNGSNDGLTPVERQTQTQPVGAWSGTPHPRRRSYSPRPNGSAEIPGELRSPCCRPGFDRREKGAQYRQPAGVRQEGTERRHDRRFVQHRREGRGSLRSSIHRRPPGKRKRLFLT